MKKSVIVEGSTKNARGHIENIKIPLLQRRVLRGAGRSAGGKIVLRFRRGSSLRARFLTVIDWKQQLPSLAPVRVGFESLGTQRGGFIGTSFYPQYMFFSSSVVSTTDRVGLESGFRAEGVGAILQPLKDIKLGSFVFNVAQILGGGAVYARAAGAKCALVRIIWIRKSEFVGLTLPSGERKYFLACCRANVGVVSNAFAYLRNLEAAGPAFHRFQRPRVRGVAMNPIDHPHGGGEGKSSGGRSSVSIWGWLTKGKVMVKNLRWYKRKRALSKRFF